MAPALRQKKLKLELTFTVTMNEIEPEASDSSFLRQLQQALLSDEAALSRVMIGALLNKLQGYADYLAAQDDIEPLMKVVQAFDPAAGDYPIPSGTDFALETRPLRISCMNTRLDHSIIKEQINAADEECSWETIWRDLRPDSALGRLFEQMAIPITPIPCTTQRASLHTLRVRYITQQKDGIHIEGRCACQEPFEGIGIDESNALDELWRHYKAHSDICNLARKFQPAWKVRPRPGKQ